MRIARHRPARAVWLVLLVGCELDVVPAKNHVAPAQTPSARGAGMDIGIADPQTFEVTVREYGTEAPIVGATVELRHYSPCRGNAQVCPPVRRSLQTGSDGVMRATISPPSWGIQRISASGYLTQCPVVDRDDQRHHLTDDSKKELAAGEIFIDHTQYLCHLVPPSALVVRDRATAITVAKTDPEIVAWLREHRDARTTQVELIGIHWEVLFETPSGSTDSPSAGSMRHVLVDGLDRTTSVLGRSE